MSQQHLAKIRVKVSFKEKTMGSTGSALDEILSSFLHLYIHVFKQVPDFFHLVIEFKFYRPFAEKSYNNFGAILFGKYSQPTKNFSVN